MMIAIKRKYRAESKIIISDAFIEQVGPVYLDMMSVVVQIKKNLSLVHTKHPLHKNKK